MKLYATPLSHFSRKIRILLDLYKVPYEIVDVGNVAKDQPLLFADNPLMRVPVLIDGDTWLIESDHIADYIVDKFDPSDRYQVKTKDTFSLNARAILNGIMDEEVKIIVARRTLVPVDQFSYFDKALSAINGGIAWLEKNCDKFDVLVPKYKEIHLVCLWQHLEYYDLVPLKLYKLNNIVEQISNSPVIGKTAPRVLKPK